MATVTLTTREIAFGACCCAAVLAGMGFLMPAADYMNKLEAEKNNIVKPHAPRIFVFKSDAAPGQCFAALKSEELNSQGVDKVGISITTVNCDGTKPA